MNTDNYIEQKGHVRPQDDVPTERIIHYIVKDYRRMYGMFEKLTDKLYEQQAEIFHLRHVVDSKKAEGDVRTQINNLTNKVNSLTEKMVVLKKERNHAVGKYNKLRARMLKLQNLLTMLPQEIEEMDAEGDEL